MVSDILVIETAIDSLHKHLIVLNPTRIQDPSMEIIFVTINI